MVNREIGPSGTTWTGMTLHTLFTASGKEGTHQMWRVLSYMPPGKRLGCR